MTASRIRFPLVPVAAGFLLVALASLSAAETIRGRVVDQLDATPIAGARIELVGSGLVASSDAGGVFVFDTAAGGTAVLRVVAEGFELATITVPRDTGEATLDIRLTRRPLRIYEEVVVAASRDAAPLFAVPRSVTVVTAAELDRRMPRTVPEALMDLPGLLVQKTNHGGGAPYLRGLVGNQVLVLVDGIRLNNATFRYGPNQYLATIDPASIERIEVVRGSGSVLHGSDALGGVINLVPRRPRLSDAGMRVTGTASGKLMSSGMERSGRAELSVSGPRLAAQGGVSVRRFGDLRAGGDLGVEAPSGYDEVAADLAVLLRLSSSSLLTAGFQHVHQSVVPRFDQVVRGWAEYAFDPQARRLGYVRLEHLRSTPWARTLTVTGSWHHSVEGRRRQRLGSTTRITEDDVVGVGGLAVEVKSAPRAGFTAVSGVETYRDRIRSWRADVDSAAGTVTAKRGLYPDGARAASIAAFSHASWSVGRLGLEGGTRVTRYSVSADDPLFGSLSVSPTAWVSSVAAGYAVSPGVRLVGSVAQAFRAPNVDDLSTLGAFDFGVEVPSPDLDPERSVGLEGGLHLRLERFSGSATVFRSNLRDLIDRVRGTFGGSAFYEGQPVYRRQNVGEAYVQGVELQGEWQVSGSLVVFGHATHTYGQQTTANQPMRRIPPFNGLVGTRWTRPRGAWLEAAVRFAAAQRRLSSGDQDDYRIAPGGTPGWTVVSLSGSWPLNAALDLTGSLHNLFDEAYRIHGSGIDGYGRSAWIGTRVRF